MLVPDNSVYLALHSLSYAWPCLSFDVLRDSLGSDRGDLPAHGVGRHWYTSRGGPGTGKAKDEVVVMRLGGLSKLNNTTATPRTRTMTTMTMLTRTLRSITLLSHMSARSTGYERDPRLSTEQRFLILITSQRFPDW